MASIQEIWGGIKGSLDRGAGEWGIPILVLLVGLASFGLGRLSVLQGAESVVSITESPQQLAASAMTVGGQVVASRSGSVYHYPWCAGASTIKETNKIWFKDETAARKAGYTPAKNCKGLE